jgi:hypothetical protein
MQLNYLYVWVGVMAVVLLIAPLIRNNRGRKPPKTEEFVIAGFALGGAIALIKVLIKLLTQEKLQADLDFDGSIALCISSALGIYFSLKEVWKLF